MTDSPNPKHFIVCDIDNTLKMGNSLFSSPPVEGMRDIVRELYSTLSGGASFLSQSSATPASPSSPAGSPSSPPPPPSNTAVFYLTNRYGPFSLLYDPKKWLKQEGFPDGRVVARKWTDIKGYLSRNPGHKKSALSSILSIPPLASSKTAPPPAANSTPTANERVGQRRSPGDGGAVSRWVLLGDSGESDARVYVDTCRALHEAQTIRHYDAASEESTGEDGSSPTRAPTTATQIFVGIRVLKEEEHRGKLEDCYAQLKQLGCLDRLESYGSSPANGETHSPFTCVFAPYKDANDLRAQLKVAGVLSG